jgi:hypothetical protein
MEFSCNRSFQIVLTLVVTLSSIFRCYLFLLGCSLGVTRRSSLSGQFRKFFIEGRQRILRKMAMVQRKLSPVQITQLEQTMKSKGNTFKMGILRADSQPVRHICQADHMLFRI